MAHDGNRSPDGIGGALDVVRRHRRALYGFTLLVSVLTAVLGSAIVAGGFAAAWDTFEGVRDYADRNIANEDSYVAYADGGLPPLVRVGAVVSLLSLVLGLLVVSVLHSAYAVGDSHATRDGGPLSTRELWRRTRQRFPAALGVNALTGLAVGAVEVAALVLWSLVESGEVPGVEPTPLHGTATPQYTLVGWVLPIAVGCLGPLLYSRLSVATAETVLERRSPFVALYRSWVLTRRARWRVLGVGTLVTVAAVLVFCLARYAAAPLAHFAGLGMLWLSDDNVWITGVLVMILPTAVALLLLPPVVMPLVCAVFARLHGELRAREEAGDAAR
ncbi:hypothetical protein GCM10010313_11630 [Streptomyces violarus]|uniref:Uncharacterized protein n=1 Tax=Streptomyces violarus TaxID=67380 RepID=A0A7W4ZLK7_9ACTN|nr:MULTISPECIES: hypothetical protein [Streptomyces]MBB3074699.1 hypothetical protein [Streptomyces violarus]WRT97365.1 hypothetical protein VJ737_06570 [Streptomyces sp. CGMCC 4.1772]GHD00405.1 hypothetical protein GCM10010313_11630 [Streptomyces violarus]